MQLEEYKVGEPFSQEEQAHGCRIKIDILFLASSASRSINKGNLIIGRNFITASAGF
jgi:hypothetical protein